MAPYCNLILRLPLWSPCARVDLPEASSAEERIPIVPEFNSLRELVQLLGVAAAEHDIIGDE